MPYHWVTQEIKPRHELYFGMYSDEANIMLHSELEKIKAMTDLAPKDLRQQLLLMEIALEDAGHREVSDTEVRLHVTRYINKQVTQPRDWKQMDFYYEFF